MTTCITVMGTGLALRGPDGSMVRAVEGMYKQRAIVFRPGVRFEMIQVMYLSIQVIIQYMGTVNLIL